MTTRLVPRHDRRHESTVYRLVFVPVSADEDSERAVAEACVLAAPGGLVTAVAPVEVPLELPLDAPLSEEAEETARAALRRARAVGQSYGVAVRTRIVPTRAAGEAVVHEAEREGAEAIVVHMRRAGRLDHATEYVLRHAACRVLLATT